jgi:hypothetical protein
MILLKSQIVKELWGIVSTRRTLLEFFATKKATVRGLQKRQQFTLCNFFCFHRYCHLVYLFSEYR